ncbi:hypothetical protein BH11BAC4_BH11BAC4_25340 [soil metagenome]
MKYINKSTKTSFLLGLAAMLVFSSCNKDLEQFPGTPAAGISTDPALGDVIKANADDSLYYRMIVKSGLLATINNKTTTYTMFVPGNSAMRSFITAASGGLVPPGAPDAVFSGFITANLPAASAAGIVSYNTCPQALFSSSIPSTFPNFQYPSILNPAPTLSALLRLTTFPTTNNGAWLNNVPIVPALNVVAGNGVIHHIAAVVTPPQRYLWDRINTDAGLTYLKAAIIRADSGTIAPGTLVGALSNIGANLTVFAPTDAAFQATLTGAIYQGLVAAGYPAGASTFATASALASSPTVFSNPLLYSVLTARTVQGIVVYHVLGTRAFTNNFPTTATLVKTLLNGGVPTHPGISIKATFGVPFVTAATIKGLGNATDANVIINAAPLIPDPSGTSDQHYLNGVLHKIDQVLLPQ